MPDSFPARLGMTVTAPNGIPAIQPFPAAPFPQTPSMLTPWWGGVQFPGNPLGSGLPSAGTPHRNPSPGRAFDTGRDFDRRRSTPVVVYSPYYVPYIIYATPSYYVSEPTAAPAPASPEAPPTPPGPSSGTYEYMYPPYPAPQTGGPTGTQPGTAPQPNAGSSGPAAGTSSSAEAGSGTSSPAVSASPRGPNGDQVTLLALQNSTVLAVVDYWLEGDRLWYKTTGGVTESVPLAHLDLTLTQRLNRERGVRLVFETRP